MREPGFLGVILHGLPDLSKIPPDPDIIDVTPTEAPPAPRPSTGSPVPRLPN
jgi:hypothetical protein